MALYRNIAGFNPHGQIGLLSNLTDYFTPTTTAPTPTTIPETGGSLTLTDSSTITLLPAGTTWGSGTTITDVSQQLADIHAAVEAENLRRYNYLLATSPFDLTQQGYYVTDDGYVHVYTDAAHTTSAGYLDLDIIQGIENAAGTAGTLFMHMNLPLIAKDTAGYAGGNRASEGATTMYSTPIADVLAIPSAPTGPNVVTDYTPQVTTVPGATPITSPSGTSATTTQPATATPGGALSTGLGSNMIGLVALGLAALAVAKTKKLLFVGGLGLLYYSMAKNKIN